MENFEDTYIPLRRSDKSKRITILSEAEKSALYELPDFDDFQRTEFFAMTEKEHAIIFERNGLRAQVYCILQIGYFKAKHTFFKFTLQDIPHEDIAFIMERYFHGMTLAKLPLPSKEYYLQRNEIVNLFGYRLWLENDFSILFDRAVELAKNDITPTFILPELIVFLNDQKIVRPGYTTLQTIIGDALASERNRVAQLIDEIVDEPTQIELKKLLVREDALSELAVIKQDSKNFGYKMMTIERQKRATLEPLYQIAKKLLLKLEISQQNKNYYASLANFYSIYDLRRLKPQQTYLYLLCYAWQRYQQLNDNLVSSFCYQLKKLEEETKSFSKQQFIQSMTKRQQEAPQVGRLILLYVDEAIDDSALFGTVRNKAFNIMPKDSLITAGQRLCEKSPSSQIDFLWTAVDKVTTRCKKNLRPLAMSINFSSSDAQNPWLIALNWIKIVFSRQQTLANQPVSDIPTDTIPKRLRPYLLVLDKEGKETSIRGDRYEFWIYRQIRKRFNINELYLNDR